MSPNTKPDNNNEPNHSYFSTLNYTLANEDTAMELEMLPENSKHVLSVAGSGGRVLPLLAKNPTRITCVDLAKEQLFLTELRFEALRALNHSEYLSFWGYPPAPSGPEERKALFQRIRLSPPAQEFLSRLFEERNWESILYVGKWESTFAKLSKINRRIMGRRAEELFEAENLFEQEKYLRSRFPRQRWKLVLLILGNAAVFNALLYKGKFPKKNIPKSSVRFYAEAFERLFHQGPARENFFLQLAFFGKIRHPEGNPIECDPDVYSKAKAALNSAQVDYRQGDALGVAQSLEHPVDFFSFSDVPSYFSGDTEKNYLQVISKKLTPGALVVLRHYLHVPEGSDKTGYRDVTSEYKSSISREKLQVYDVEVLKWEGR